MFLNKQDVFQLQNGVKMVSLSGKIARYKIFVNVGGADMAFNGGDERIAFGPMAKGQKKYGATASVRKKNEQIVVYNLQRGDTLQGIAIKFGVHTEQIRRVNQLWTNDSLFLRDKLLIPVVNDKSEDGRPEGTDSDANSSFGNSTNPCSPLGEDGGFQMQPHWSHPLCDSMEEDCIIVSPESVKLCSTSSNMDLNSSADTWCSSKDSLFANSNVDAMSNASAMSNGTHSSSHSPLASTKSKHSSLDNGTSYHRSNNTDEGHASSTAPESPTSPSSTSSSKRAIVDQSEKSAHEFLSRIDSAIASSKKQAKHKAEEKTAPWVTFDSDSESSDHRNSSGTSVTRQGRHLRYSLRKLEKAQEELFQL